MNYTIGKSKFFGSTNKNNATGTVAVNTPGLTTKLEMPKSLSTGTLSTLLETSQTSPIRSGVRPRLRRDTKLVKSPRSSRYPSISGSHLTLGASKTPTATFLNALLPPNVVMDQDPKPTSAAPVSPSSARRLESKGTFTDACPSVLSKLP